MDSKLIFFDIDGTLITHGKHELAPRTAEAIRRARANGHVCVINTGRTAALVMDWLPQLAPFDGYLCGCGTQIFFQGQSLMHRTLTQDEAKHIIDGLEAHKIDAILEGENMNFTHDLGHMHTATFRKYIADRYSQRMWQPFENAPGRFDKFFCFADDSQSVYDFMKDQADLLDLIDREHGYFEIVPKGCSKATAMDFLLDHLNKSGNYPKMITTADMVAIGDSNNDLPMLQHAGTAIAMAKSSTQVLELADFVTTTVMDDGIYNALAWLGCL
ncbi:MAG: HAD family phosphatase [Lachnospiraceae bacterium]|nr:HAD family phosphatase [Lachnospiraceae bacterium]